MNIYELRNQVTVTIYALYKDGAVIRYINKGKLNYINLSEYELVNELIAIGSIDEEPMGGILPNYNFSQWDALNIAIRFEQAREMDKEINNSDIGKSINKILNHE